MALQKHDPHVKTMLATHAPDTLFTPLGAVFPSGPQTAALIKDQPRQTVPMVQRVRDGLYFGLALHVVFGVFYVTAWPVLGVLGWLGGAAALWLGGSRLSRGFRPQGLHLQVRPTVSPGTLTARLTDARGGPVAAVVHHACVYDATGTVHGGPLAFTPGPSGVLQATLALPVHVHTPDLYLGVLVDAPDGVVRPVVFKLEAVQFAVCQAGQKGAWRACVLCGGLWDMDGGPPAPQRAQGHAGTCRRCHAHFVPVHASQAVLDALESTRPAPSVLRDLPLGAHCPECDTVCRVKIMQMREVHVCGGCGGLVLPGDTAAHVRAAQRQQVACGAKAH